MIEAAVPFRRLGGALALLLASPLFVACANDFWDRSPCVGAVTEAPRACPDPYAYPYADAQPQPRAYTPPSTTPEGCAPPSAEPRAWAPPPATSVAPPADAPPPREADPGLPTSEEQAVLAAVNRIRAERGLRPFTYHPALYLAARQHSEEQQRHGYMGHGSPDPSRRTLAQRVMLAGYAGLVYAEVVAWGYQDVSGVVNGWMNSPDHRAILVDRELTQAAFSRVGAYWTGNFGVPRTASGATAYVPRAPARSEPAPRAPAYAAPPVAPAPRGEPPVARYFQAPPQAAPSPPPARPPAMGG